MHVNEFDEATNLLTTVLFPLSKDCQNEKLKKRQKRCFKPGLAAMVEPPHGKVVKLTNY